MMRTIGRAAAVVLLVGLSSFAVSRPASADPNVIHPGAGGPNVMHAFAPDVTAICVDGSSSTSISAAGACSANGGVQTWLTAAAPAAAVSASSTALLDSAPAPAPAATTVLPRTQVTSFQAPSSAGSARSSAYDGENPTGPVNVATWLDSGRTCLGGPVRVFATVTDANGNGIDGATVTGYVQFRSTGSSFTFPTTDAGGNTSFSFNTGSPGGGYRVVFSIHADSQGLAADDSTSCYAP